MNKDIKAKLMEAIEKEHMFYEPSYNEGLYKAADLINELIPEGMVLVPEEPSEVMLNAAIAESHKAAFAVLTGDNPADIHWQKDRNTAVYKAMLSAYKQETGK